ncbi:Microtubule-associated protein 10 [Sciurus carolinensis]|uniref:Microtubule-associated protein 10 n=1 Tax=Sciurus carolinensis TaxID=30640 RepID=A0AA41SUU8_SCICA|nr:Microtubule-associated protein 10 [Sciurus carolinensis]
MPAAATRAARAVGPGGKGLPEGGCPHVAAYSRSCGVTEGPAHVSVWPDPGLHGTCCYKPALPRPSASTQRPAWQQADPVSRDFRSLPRLSRERTPATSGGRAAWQPGWRLSDSSSWCCWWTRCAWKPRRRPVQLLPYSCWISRHFWFARPPGSPCCSAAPRASGSARPACSACALPPCAARGCDVPLPAARGPGSRGTFVLLVPAGRRIGDLVLFCRLAELDGRARDPAGSASAALDPAVAQEGAPSPARAGSAEYSKPGPVEAANSSVSTISTSREEDTELDLETNTFCPPPLYYTPLTQERTLPAGVKITIEPQRDSP